MAETLVGSTVVPEGYAQFTNLLIPIPEFINPEGQAQDVWGIQYEGQTYGWTTNAEVDLTTPEGRMRAAELAAQYAVNTGLDCRIGAPIDKHATFTAETDHHIVVSSTPGMVGLYLQDPGDASSHRGYTKVLFGGWTKIKDYTAGQRATYRKAFARIMVQLIPTDGQGITIIE